MTNPETENSDSKNTELDESDKLNIKEIFATVKSFILNQFILFAMTSFLFSIGTFIGGFIIQRKIEKKIIPSMITYVPYILFTTFYLISGAVHLISALYGFFKAGWFLSLTIFLRLLAIVTGLFSIYLNYSKKDKLIHKIEYVWFQESYALIVSYYQDYFNCCGWNTTTAVCSYTRCYDFINDQIDEIARMIGIASFVINTFQVGLCVDSIFAVALQIEVPKKNKVKSENKNNNADRGKGKNKDKDNTKDKSKENDKNKDKEKNKSKEKAKDKNKSKNIKLRNKHESSEKELDEIASSVHFDDNVNRDSSLFIQNENDTPADIDDDINSSKTSLNSTQTDTNGSNLSILDTSSNTQNTQNSLYEVSPSKPKNKKSKENQNKKSKKSTDDEIEQSLISDTTYK